jgi:AcrR family transcriptional regulator
LPPEAPENKKRSAPRYGEGRDALLDAAIRIVSRDGVGSLTYRAVATEAEVSHTLVAYHFSSLASLVAEALVRETAQSITKTQLSAPLRSVEDFARSLPETLDSDPNSAAFQYEVVLAARHDPELSAAVRGLWASYLAAVRDGLEDAGLLTSDALARLVFAALDGLVLHYLTFGNSGDIRESLDELRTLLKSARRTKASSQARSKRLPAADRARRTAPA